MALHDPRPEISQPIAPSLQDGAHEGAPLLAVHEDARVRLVRNPLSPDATVELFREMEIVEHAAPESARIMPGITVLTSKGPFPETTKHLQRQLHTRVYLANGILTVSDLSADGLYDDDYNDRADQTVVINGEKVAACRMIHPENGNLLSLPTLDHFRPFSEEKLRLLKEVAGVKRLTDIGQGDIVEFSGLGMENIPGRPQERDQFKAAVALYLNVLAQSVQAGHKLWVMNVEPWLYRRVARMAYERNMHVLGERKPYQGAPTMPIALNPLTVARDLLRAGDDDPIHKKLGDVLRASLCGADATKIPKDIRQLLRQQGVELRYDSLRERAAKTVASLDYVSMGIVSGVTVGRDLGIHSDPRFHGDFPALIGIDLSTGLAYSQGLSKLFRGHSVPEKVAGAGAMVAFNIPTYLYLFWNSNGIPDRSLEYLGGFFAAGIAVEGVKRFQRNKREQELQQALQYCPEHAPISEGQYSGLLAAEPLQ